MRKRLVDLGLTAVGAAALIGLVKALPLLAAFITFPTTWVAGQILTSSDLNAEFAAVSSQVNGNLDDTNIAAGAAIKGSKLADSPNGLTTTKLNDLAVTGGKLAVGASLAGSVRDPEPPTTEWSYGGYTTEATIHTTAITARGGPILMTALVDVALTNADAIVRLKIDGVVRGIGHFGTTGGGQGTVTVVGLAPTPGAGAHSVTVTVQCIGAGTCFGGGGQTLVMEFS